MKSRNNEIRVYIDTEVDVSVSDIIDEVMETSEAINHCAHDTSVLRDILNEADSDEIKNWVSQEHEDWFAGLESATDEELLREMEVRELNTEYDLAEAIDFLKKHNFKVFKEM